jgi:hypothetical protein
MRYLPAFNIWTTPVELLRHAQPGQHVYAGDPTDRNSRGVFMGVKRSGVVVVAWSGNTRTRATRTEQRDYLQTLRAYALGDKQR